MKLNKYSSFLLGFFVLNIIYWVGIQTSKITTLPINLLFSFSTAVLAFLGGIMGLMVSRHWGGAKSAVGKAVLLMSLGTLSWSLGNFVWSFYNFVLHQELPYPSLSDIGYALAVPLWVIGTLYLSKATGVKFSLRKTPGRILAVILPVVGTIVSYYFLFVVARKSSLPIEGDWLKVFLDFYYPLGDWVILTVAFLIFGLSWKYLGGKFKWPVFVTLLGFVLMFSADVSFSYTTTVGTYFNGNFADMLFAAAMFVIGFGITSFDAKEIA